MNAQGGRVTARGKKKNLPKSSGGGAAVLKDDGYSAASSSTRVEKKEISEKAASPAPHIKQNQATLSWSKKDITNPNNTVFTKYENAAQLGADMGDLGAGTLKIGSSGLKLLKSLKAASAPVKIETLIKTVSATDKIYDASKLPMQIHHFASNKSKTFSPQFKKIADIYGLDLDADWNKMALPHQGRHPNDYHKFTLDGMNQAKDEAGPDISKFLELYDRYVKQPIINNPELLRKSGWQ